MRKSQWVRLGGRLSERLSIPAANRVNGSLAVSDLHGGAGEYEYSSGRLKEWIDYCVEVGRMF